LKFAEWGDLEEGERSLHNMTWTINDRLDGMAMFPSLLFSAPFRARFEKRASGPPVRLAGPSGNSREAF
jgi:hypothetical protein